MDAGAYFGDLGRGFEDGNIMTSEKEGNSGTKATQASPNDYDLGERLIGGGVRRGGKRRQHTSRVVEGSRWTLGFGRMMEGLVLDGV